MADKVRPWVDHVESLTLPIVKVHFDSQVAALQRRGGISRYFTELMRSFQRDAMHGVDLVNGYPWARNLHLIEAGLARPLPARLLQRARVVAIANRATGVDRGVPADVLHHTYYDRSYLRLSSQKLRVVTIYDMIPEILPELFPSGNPHQDKFEFVRASDLILAISESTKQDLLRIYGDPGVPVVVTPLGIGEAFFIDSSPLMSLPQSYVLFVGGRGGYKDFDVLARAFAQARLPEHFALVAVGEEPLSDSELSLLERLGIRDRVVRVSVEDAELPRVYRHAACFVFPSRYEGFGLPTLEAMAAGCVALLADVGSHPEVGGDAALYFEPGDAEQLSLLLQRVTLDRELRSRHARLGVKRAREFSWLRTARATAQAYRQALGEEPDCV